MTEPLDPDSPLGRLIAEELALVCAHVELAIEKRRAAAATAQPIQEGTTAA